MATTQYIGSRYVPILADPVEWSSTKTYEPLTIVTHEGNSYTSRQFVPVGIDIANGDYWALTGNYNAQIELYRQETAQAVETAQQRTDDAVEQVNEWLTDAQGQYSAKLFAFNTVADMQRAYSLLYVGAICHTNGFHESDDGGAAWYVVTDTGPSNGMDVLACGNLFATLVVVDSIVTPEMYGAYGNGISDDLPSINKAINGGNKIIIFSNKTYMVHGSILVYSDTKFIGNGTTLTHDRPCRMFNKWRSTDDTIVDNIIIDGFTIQGISGVDVTYTENDWANNTYDCACVLGTNVHNIIMRNCVIEDFTYGVFLGGQYGQNATFENITFKNCRRPIDTFCDDTLISDCKFYDCMYAIQIEPNGPNMSSNTKIVNCYAENTSNIPNSLFVNIFPSVHDINISNCKVINYNNGISNRVDSSIVANPIVNINDCYFYITIGTAIFTTSKMTISNCYFKSNATNLTTRIIAIQCSGALSDDVVINDCIIEDFTDAIYSGSPKVNGLLLKGYVPFLARACHKTCVLNNVTTNESTYGYFSNQDSDFENLVINNLTYMLDIPSATLNLISSSPIKSYTRANTQQG